MDTTTKKNLGKLLALYPTPVTVIGAFVDGKQDFLPTKLKFKSVENLPNGVIWARYDL